VLVKIGSKITDIPNHTILWGSLSVILIFEFLAKLEWCFLWCPISFWILIAASGFGILKLNIKAYYRLALKESGFQWFFTISTLRSHWNYDVDCINLTWFFALERIIWRW